MILLPYHHHKTSQNEKIQTSARVFFKASEHVFILLRILWRAEEMQLIARLQKELLEERNVTTTHLRHS